MPDAKTFESLLAKGPDSALLRFSLANAYATESRPVDAIEHLIKALDFDDQFSAAWKLLGRCYFDTENYADAVRTYEQGVLVADARGDKQAAKEMGVFLKRSVKKLG